MDIELFNYDLPNELIAHKPAEPRDACKFLVYDRKQASISHDIFYNILKYLQEGDVLVLNNTRVLPYRLFGNKSTGGKVEVLFVHHLERNKWKALIRGKVKEGSKIDIDDSTLNITVGRRILDAWEVSINVSLTEFKNILERVGQAPLPPYISAQKSEKKIRSDYQTVYSHVDGSVAAPTAGLHFTDSLLERIQAKGVQIEYVTLHVGLGTFSPIRTNDITKHEMHEEHVHVRRSTMQRLVRAHKEGRRIIAVGTTSVRVLEGVVPMQLDRPLQNVTSYYGDVNIFIYPGYTFKVVQGLITNFHLPKSSLIMLVSALMGRDECLRVYNEAVANKYAFYSFGDAMMIL